MISLTLFILHYSKKICRIYEILMYVLCTIFIEKTKKDMFNIPFYGVI